MNKELIKKYKKEFNHSLNGGSIYYKSKSLTGCTSEFPINMQSNEIEYIVIDDEYVEFRKALAEGKNIQYNPKLQTHDRWDDIKPYNDMFSDTVDNYRIKPDKVIYTHKIGDFTRCKRHGIADYVFEIAHIDDDFLWDEDENKFKKSDCMLWEPVINEYCWYKTRLCEVNSIIDNTLIITLWDNNRTIVQINKDDITEPFIGSLPKSLNV